MCHQIQRARRGARIVLGPAWRQPSHAYIDARTSRLSLSRRHLQQPHRPIQARWRRSKFHPVRPPLGEKPVISALKAFTDRFLGRGEATITVPSFDGALKPNQILESAETVGQFEAPEDLATDGKTLYIADGVAILRLDGAATTEVRRFDRPITALCCLPDGGIAAALDGREVLTFTTPSAANAATTFADTSMNAINALSPGAGGTLVATDGSATRPTGQWVHDLMERGRTGRVLVLDIASGRVRTIASGLYYAFGACAAGDAVFVSESWQHRLIAIASEGTRRPI